MPELPDVTVYVEALGRFIGGRTIRGIQIRSPFLVRTYDPPVIEVVGRSVGEIKRQGKRIIWKLEPELYLVFHLMIAGRFHWKKLHARPRGKNDLASFEFDHGVLMLTEASQKKRAALHVLSGWKQVAEVDRGGLEVFDCDPAAFRQSLLRENHTLKRVLTDPATFSGIGNAYSDEILHAAGLSPLQLTKNLSDAEMTRLFEAVQSTLKYWTDRLRAEVGSDFPENVTAFREGMAVHGRYGERCPVCGTEIQRIVYAENETNYCPRCQTGGKLLADRSLSRLLKGDWPKRAER